MSDERKVIPLPERNTSEQAGNIKVTREDWLTVAMDLLVSDGEEKVKVLTIGERLGVSRSSFYWYFKSRQDLLDALLDHWRQTNTAALVEHAEMPSATITEAVCNVFRCFVDPDRFNTSLDFAIRDWARRSGKVRNLLDRSDARRIGALEAMFARHGYGSDDALVRARTLYYMQLGYNDAELNEPMADRRKLLPHYIVAFTGKEASAEELEIHDRFFRSIGERTKS